MRETESSPAVPEAERLRAEADRLDDQAARKAALLRELDLMAAASSADDELSAALSAAGYDAARLDFARAAELAATIRDCYAQRGAPDTVLTPFTAAIAEYLAASRTRPGSPWPGYRITEADAARSRRVLLDAALRHSEAAYRAASDYWRQAP